MNRMTQIPTRAFLVLSIIRAGSALAQSYDIDWHTVDLDGELSSVAGASERAGAVGKADPSSFARPLIGGGFEVVSGFWPVAAPASVSGDFDFDVDLDEFTEFAGGCVSGPDVPAGAGCGLRRLRR